MKCSAVGSGGCVAKGRPFALLRRSPSCYRSASNPQQPKALPSRSAARESALENSMLGLNLRKHSCPTRHAPLSVKPHLNRFSSIARSQPDKQVDLDAFATRIELANTKLLADFRADMSKELADFRVDMSKELADFRAGMSKEMAEYKVSFEKSLYELKMDVKLEIQQLKLISLFAVAAVVLLASSDSILGTVAGTIFSRVLNRCWVAIEHPARLPIGVDALSNAHVSYQAAAHGATTLTALGCSRLPIGPFADCPLCVTLPGAPQALTIQQCNTSALGTAWHCMQDMSPLVKYMTHAHRTDAMQIILGGIAFDKQANMVDFLIGKHADMLKRKADLVMQLAELKTKAAAAGITDGEDAAAQYKAQHQRTKTIAANADWPVSARKRVTGVAGLQSRFSKCRVCAGRCLQAQAFRYLSGQVLLVDTCSDSLPMPTPEMADLLTDGKKVTQLGAMEEKVQMLGMTHRVNNLSGSWCSPDVAGSVHTLGLAKLKAAKMASLRSMVWQAVLLVAQLETQQKEWGVADKDTRAKPR
ncbi:hypothetical protein QJQ45_025677 [Haematococcus lacustris]|nr:hypothetical protein QJQ45_025677 [Haematococcus lacustris]